MSVSTNAEINALSCPFLRVMTPTDRLSDGPDSNLQDSPPGAAKGIAIRGNAEIPIPLRMSAPVVAICEHSYSGLIGIIV